MMMGVAPARQEPVRARAFPNRYLGTEHWAESQRPKGRVRVFPATNSQVHCDPAHSHDMCASPTTGHPRDVRGGGR